MVPSVPTVSEPLDIVPSSASQSNILAEYKFDIVKVLTLATLYEYQIPASLPHVLGQQRTTKKNKDFRDNFFGLCVETHEQQFMLGEGK